MASTKADGVLRKVFTSLCERIEKERDIWPYVIVRYEGTNVCGIISIESLPGRSEEYKRVIQMFYEEYCK